MTIAVPTVERVPDIELAFGEGLAWDGELGRLYFVDAVPRRIHWLEWGLWRGRRGAVSR